MRGRPGQVAIYLVMTLVALTMTAVLAVNVFLAVRSKNHVEHAGDAAALAAAREQAKLLNRIGRLNVAHIRAAAEGDAARCAEIVAEQRRLALLGPIDGLVRANDAAKRNGMEANDDFTKILAEHVADIRNVYAGEVSAGGTDPYPEPWPGAWREYADALASALAGGLAFGPDNCEYYYAPGGHMLVNPLFYHAIAGQSWCWFNFNARDLLANYSSFHGWDPLPAAHANSFDNCEIFSLHVRAVTDSLSNILARLAREDEGYRTPSPQEELDFILERYGESGTAAPVDLRDGIVSSAGETWFLFETDAWRTWDEMHVESGLPIVGSVKPEYDVRGAAAICRCREESFSWSAAAKPFGFLDRSDGAEVATACGALVLPCFTDVRLVPIDAVGGQTLATADYDWVTHVRHHLGGYLRYGIFDGNCHYCRQLRTWENPVFRAKGNTWLKFHAGECVRPTGGGSEPGGGTCHAH